MTEITSSHFIREIFEKHWTSVFLIDALKKRNYTYQQFFSLLSFQNKKLKNLHLKSGEKVVCLVSNQAEFLSFYLAALTLGVIVIPIDPNKGEQEIQIIFNEAKADWFIFEEKISAEKCPQKKYISWELFLSDAPEMLDQSSLTLFDQIEENNTFITTFTSGSTGVPKGVKHSFKNLFLSALAFKERFQFNQSNRFYHHLPMSYMAGILNLFILPLISKSSLVVGDPFSIQSIARFWEKPILYEANSFWLIPTMLSLLLKLDRGSEGIEYAKNTPIVACVGTAPLNLHLKEQFETRYGFKLYESYGLSETLFISTSYPSQKQVNEGVGEPLDGVELQFESDNEILLSVPWMFQGYSNVAHVNLKIFPSGDLGEVDASGSLRITGRKKDLIIRGGVNLSPRRIEEFVSAYNMFSEQVVLGMEDLVLGEKTVCFYVSSTEQDLLDKNLKKLNLDLMQKIGRDYQIDSFERLKEIPKLTNGKIDKITLKNKWNLLKYVSQN